MITVIVNCKFRHSTNIKFFFTFSFIYSLPAPLFISHSLCLRFDCLSITRPALLNIYKAKSV